MIRLKNAFEHVQLPLWRPNLMTGGGGVGGGGGNQHRNTPNPVIGGGQGPRGSGNQNARVYVGNLAWDVAWQVRLFTLQNCLRLLLGQTAQIGSHVR